MITLGLDTTGPLCTASLVGFARVKAHRSERIGRGHAERLAPMVQEILSEADLSPANIERIAVCTGPGSFTGLRVALSFARAFALPQNIPVVGLTSLEAMAAEADPERRKRVVSIADVKRGEVCWAAFDRGRWTHSPTTQTMDQARKFITALKAEFIVGDGASLLGFETNITDVSGPVLAWLANHRNPADNPPDPLYSRAPDAKLPGGKSL